MQNSLQHPFQIAEIGLFVDDETFDLMEHRRMRLVGIATIGAAGADDADRRALREHRAHLHRARMRAQQFTRAGRIRFQEERVVHLARRMIRLKIELGEIIIVGFDIRSFGDGEAEIGEDRRKLVHDLRNRVQPAEIERTRMRGEGHIACLAGKAGFERRLLEHGAARGEGIGDLVLHGIDDSALRLAVVGRHFAEPGQKGGDGALLAEGRDAHGLERGLIGGGGDGGENFLFQRRNIGHGTSSVATVALLPCAGGEV